MTTIHKLISVAPFSEENKKQLLEAVDTFSDAKKLEVEEACWALISTEYQQKLQYALQLKALELLNGTGTLTAKDREKIEDELSEELSKRLQVTNDIAELDEVRTKLEQHLKATSSA